jgi:hypothetical protein
MRTQFIAVAFVTASLSMTAFAEQPVQAGETLESLSKAKVTTTINGQPGSLEELVNSGKVQLISAQSNPVQTQPLNSQDVQAVTPHQSEMADPAATPAPSIDPNAQRKRCLNLLNQKNLQCKQRQQMCRIKISMRLLSKSQRQ